MHKLKGISRFAVIGRRNRSNENPIVAISAMVIFLGMGAGSPAFAQQRDVESIRSAKRVMAVRITETIRVDGLLDDPVWAKAEAASEFYQQFPDEFQPSTTPTEVKFLYDDTNLYVGAMLYDDEPERLITNDLKRDFSGFDTDSFGLVLDTFHDRSNSYGFLVNPGGAMRDAMNADNGRLHDFNWNGVWSARTAILPNGWSLEMVIPFKTLRFPVQESLEWGMNVVRNSRAINERSTWAPVPRQITHYNVAYAGMLGGLAGVRPGANLYVKPFATAELGKGVPRGSGWDGDADGGIDVKWGITTSLVMDATYRTDFSQVEADEQQINLTRFSLFFPEKREFFLESPGNFQIGLQDVSRRDLVPFFTRNIGLVNGQPVPVVGGVRLTGRAGQQTVGVLNMQTEDHNGRPGDNFTAAVFRRPLSATTSLGAFYFGREAEGVNAFNRVGGLDFRYSPRRTLDIEAFVMRSATSGQEGDFAARTGLLLQESRHSARVGFLHIGDSFRHDLGFVPRRGIGTFYSTYSRIIRAANPAATIRQHTIGGSFEATGNDTYDQLLTRLGGASYTMLFKDEGQLSAGVNTTFEHLDSSATISGLVIPPGEYRWEDAEISYSSNRSARISGSIGFQGGDFWTGRRRAVNGSFRFRLNAHLAVSTTMSRNIITLPQGKFTGDLVGLRVDTSFTPRMFLNAFIQYNGSTDTWLSNIRYNLIHRPLSDIYIVWNETRIAGETQRALLMKYTHLLSF
jgi:hypothetical protein